MLQPMGDVHDRLKTARVNAGFDSAAQAAKALGVTESRYRAYENGQNKYGPDEAAQFARRFGVRAAWLLLGEDPMAAGDAPSSPEEKVIMDRLARLDPEQRARLMSAFELMIEAVAPREPF